MIKKLAFSVLGLRWLKATKSRPLSKTPHVPSCHFRGCRVSLIQGGSVGSMRAIDISGNSMAPEAKNQKKKIVYEKSAETRSDGAGERQTL